jgi:hypothetical protein
MSIRKLGTLLAVMCAAFLIVPVAAGAQTTPTTNSVHVTSLNNIPVKGTAKNGKTFAGHFAVDRFVTRNGKSYALGTVTGKLGNKSVSLANVAIPAKVAKSGNASAAATCPILHLDLGPLNLNLLGLTVHLNQVVLDINAVSGSGNLLGNLLCSVANLLNGNSLLTSQLTGLLNILNSVLGNIGVLGL